MKPLPPDLPNDIFIETVYDADLSDQVDFEPKRGQAWAVWLLDTSGKTRIGEVHLGKTKYRLQTIQGKPHRQAWMVNGERKSPEYDNRNAAVMGLLEIYRGGDPSCWHTPAVPEGHVNAGHSPIIEYEDEYNRNYFNDDNNDRIHVDDSHPTNTNDDENVDENIVAAQAKFSATQIKKYASCARQWAWEYLEGIKPPQGAAAELGQNCHTVLENWLSKGISPDPATREGKIVMPGLAHLPRPSKSLEVEREFLFELHGHLYRGFVDLGYWGKVEGYERIWVVHDHKTTSDFMWALTEEDLLHDVQAILYGKEAIDRHHVDEVLLSWLYMRTKRKPKSEPRRVVLTRPVIDSGMEVIEHYTDQMADLRRTHLPIVRDEPHKPGEDSIVLTLEPNAYACSAYGGCAFMDRCNLSTREKMRSIMAQEGKKQSLKERMAARKAARGGGETATPKPVEAAPSVNPPEQPSEEEQKAPLSTEEEKAANEDKKGKGGKGKGKGDAESTSTSASSSSSGSKRGRGRPKGSTNKKSEETNGVSSFSHEEAFVGIFAAAVAGGDERHMTAAEKAWATYKQEFMG